MLLLLLQFAFFGEQTAMKTLYNGQQHELPIDASNGIHRAKLIAEVYEIHLYVTKKLVCFYWS